MIPTFWTYDINGLINGLTKKARWEAKSTNLLTLTVSAGRDHHITLVINRGELMRDLIRMDKDLEKMCPGAGLIETVSIKRGRR